MKNMFATVLVAGALAAAAAGAQQASPFGSFRHDSTQPIEVTANALEVRESQSLAIFTGDVVAGQGTLRLTSDVLNVWYAGATGTGKIERLRAEGDVFLSSGVETARGAWAEYAVTSGTITMGGGVTLTQGANVVSGQQLVVDLNAGTGRVEGGRVKSIFRPADAKSP